MLDFVPFTIRKWKNAQAGCNLFTRSFWSIRFQEITLFPKICNEIIHHSMLNLLISCTITEYCMTSSISKIIDRFTFKFLKKYRKLMKKLRYLIVCFTQSYVSCFFFSIRSVFYIRHFVCRALSVGCMYVSWLVAQQTYASFGLFTLSRIACLLQLWIKQVISISLDSEVSEETFYPNL